MVMRVNWSPAREPNGLEPPEPPRAPIKPPPLPRWISTSRIKNKPMARTKKFNKPAMTPMSTSPDSARALRRIDRYYRVENNLWKGEFQRMPTDAELEESRGWA